jgi:acetyl esterase
MLDPQLQPIVDAINAAPAEADPTVDDARLAYEALSTIAGPGPDLDRVEDVTIPGPAGDVPARSYRNDGARGVLLYFHGGGHTIGSIDSHDQPCRQLAAESSATVVSVGYRLAPEHPFPAAVDDAWAAVEWADAHRGDLGGSDDAGIVVGGDSAGGNLAAVVALMARDAGVELAGQLLVYPGIGSDDGSSSLTENAEGYVLSLERIRWFAAQYAADPSDWRCDPSLASTHEGVAPAWVMTAQFDPLRDQGAAYAGRLEAAGVPVEYVNYDDEFHTFFQFGPLSTRAAEAVSAAAAWTADRLVRGAQSA